MSLPVRRLLPGLLTCLAAAAIAFAVNKAVPAASALLVAIILGALVGNLVQLPASLDPGVKVSAKRVLRIGIVLLGFQVALGDLLGLGWGVIALVVVAVAGTFAATVALGRLFGLKSELTLLIASGFSICGAAAVAGCAGVTDAEDEDVATALGLVVLMGTVMIGLQPLLVAWAGFDAHRGGIWTGASVHEVAQVVAAAGIIGGAALTVAVIVKLARVVMLAPVMALLSWRRRSQLSADAKRPPIIPLFVAGFLAAVVVRSLGWVPDTWLPWIKQAQTVLLAMAMFALGLGVKFRQLVKVGMRPVLLGALSTLVVSLIGYGGALLVG